MIHKYFQFTTVASAIFLLSSTGHCVDAAPGSALFSPQNNSVPSIRANSVAVTDVDGDGDVDIISPSSLPSFPVSYNPLPAQVLISRNGKYFENEVGRYWPIGSELTAQCNTPLLSVDLTGDRFPEVVCSGDQLGYVAIFRNIAGVLQPGSSAISSVVAQNITHEDMDFDGDTDLIVSEVVGGNPGPTSIYLNNGSGQFSLGTQISASSSLIYVAAVQVADINQDGFMDVIRAGYGGQVELFYGATGGFTQSTALVTASGVVSIKLADMDSDGDLDLITGAGSFPSGVSYFRNDPSGQWVDLSARLPFSNSSCKTVEIADFNRDSLLDIICSGYGLRLSLQTSTGVFIDGWQRLASLPVGAASVMTVSDINGDLIPDLIVTRFREEALVLINNGEKFLSQTHLNPLIEMPYYNIMDLCFADFDGDGAVEVLAASGTSGSIASNIYKINPGAQFQRRTSLQGQNVTTEACAVGDLDGDGDIDIVLANNFDDELHLNNGVGVFTPSATSISAGTSSISSDVAVADLNADGLKDIIFVGSVDSQNRTFSSRVLLNRGAGLFSQQILRIPDSPWRKVAVGDVDGDGLPEIFITSYTKRILLHNNGAGVFSPMLTPGFGGATNALFADVNGDAKLDILAVGAVANTTQPGLFLGNGRGSFSPVPAVQAGMWNSAAVFDANGDGIQDIALSANSLDGLVDTIYIQSRNGSFTARDIYNSGIPIDTKEMFPIDLDQDGDLDLIKLEGASLFPGAGWQEAGVYLNRSRHLEIRSLARRGNQVVLEFQSDNQNFNRLDLYASVLPLTSGVRTAFGLIQLQSPIFLGTVQAGRAQQLELTLPFGVNLNSVSFQGLFYGGTGSAAMSGATTAKVSR